VKLLQIWIETKEEDIKPRYDQAKILPAKNKFVVLASGGKEGLHINQDAKLSLGNFESGKSIDCKMKKGNGLFVFMIKGKTQVDQDVLGKRDSIGISGVDSVEIKAIQDSKILLIEVPMKE